MSALINENRLFSEVVAKMGAKERIIEELVENAIRAKAINVVFTLSDDLKTLICENDGDILIDFISLIKIAETGYDEVVRLHHKPAGMGVMMMIASSVQATFESGDQKLQIDSKRFFSDQEYRESRLSSIENIDTWVSGVRTTLEFDAPVAWVQRKYSEHHHLIEGLEYYFNIDIVLNAPFVKQTEPLNKREVEFGVSIKGDGILKGALIGIEKHNMSDFFSWRTEGNLFWHGKKIKVSGLQPFSIFVDGDFNALQPRLPDRTCVVNDSDSIGKVKAEIELQLHDLIQSFIDDQVKLGLEGCNKISKLLVSLDNTYDVDAMTHWFGATHNTKAFFSEFPEFEITYNGAKNDNDDPSDVTIIEKPCDVIFGKTSIRNTPAPKWVRDRMPDRMPTIKITQTDEQAEASKAYRSWVMNLVDRIEIEGENVQSIVINDEYYFTEHADEYIYIDHLADRYDETPREAIEDDVVEDVEHILSSYRQCASAEKAKEYASLMLAAICGVDRYQQKIEKIEVDFEQKEMKIIDSGKAYSMKIA